jgi:hypothetical protein
VCLIVSGCVKPGPRTQIDVPEPTVPHSILAWDGTKYVWAQIVGGPSGAIAVDPTRAPWEIDMVPVPAAKYIQAPTYTTVQPGAAAGQVVTVGPEGSAWQSVIPSGMTAKLLGINNGVLVEGKLPPPEPVSPQPLPASIKLPHADHYKVANLNQSSVWPGSGWSLPSKSYATFGQSTDTDSGYRVGHLAFGGTSDTAAYWESRLGAWDGSQIEFDLAWWSGTSGKAGADKIQLDLAYACSRAGMTAGATEPAWHQFGVQQTLTAGPAYIVSVARFAATIEECAPGDWIKLRIKRLASQPPDDFQANLNLDSLTHRWVQVIDTQ